ncbi:MAG: hypothetical protein J2P25_16180 [Nocardiopsaceae bacterium]|nr:hypothetical protein [Nocardiopsaceae bacterium]
MSPPEVNVHRKSLLRQAKEWDTQANAMGGISLKAGSSVWTGTSGLFAPAVDAYNKDCREVSTLCGEGKEEMTRISDALVGSHKNYDDIEQEILGMIKGIGH